MAMPKYTAAKTHTVLFVRVLYPSRDNDETSMLVSLSRTGLEDGMIRSRNTTTPKPPMKCVDDLQNSRLSGSCSTFSSTVPPVVVYPETASNRALMTEKGPPQRTYGSIPKMKDDVHERTMII